MSSGATARELSGRPRRESKEIPKFRLSEVRFGHLALDEIGKFFHHPFGKGCSVVAPTPDGHFTDSEEPRRRCVAAKHDSEQKIMLAAGEPAFEARSSYDFGTRWHDDRLVWLCGPISRNSFRVSNALSNGVPQRFPTGFVCRSFLTNNVPTLFQRGVPSNPHTPRGPRALGPSPSGARSFMCCHFR